MLCLNYVFYPYKIKPYISSHIIFNYSFYDNLKVKNSLWERKDLKLKDFDLLI